MNPGVPEVASILGAMGCPQDRADAMASQLLKRAHQLAAERSWSHADALAHLLRLMAGGWAAQSRGFDPGSFPAAPTAPSPSPVPRHDAPPSLP